MDTVKVLIGDQRYVTLYTIEKVDDLIASVEAATGLQGTTLPTASVTYRGKLFTLQGSTGVADKVYICVKNSSNAYEWKDLLTFRFGP